MRRIRVTLASSLSIFLLVALLGTARTAGAGGRIRQTETVVYDGSLGTLPADQGMLYAAADTSPLFDSVEVVQTHTGRGVRLDSTADYEDSAGYSTTAVTLDRQQAVIITFTVQITREDHTTSGSADKNGDNIADRAGFSVIAIGDDGQWGIELGFWEDEIWAQEGGAAPALFTHAEGAAFDTTGLTTYRLALVGDIYTLSVAGTPVLSGPLRDYTAFSGLVDPYETDNFLFFGDDTSSASAEIELTRVIVGDGYRVLLPLLGGG